jgi:hypothetical protein
LRFGCQRPLEQFVLSNCKRTAVVGQCHLGIESSVVEPFIGGIFSLNVFAQPVQLCLELLHIDGPHVQPLLKVACFLKRGFEVAIASIQICL